jgi:hypothetical protein
MRTILIALTAVSLAGTAGSVAGCGLETTADPNIAAPPVASAGSEGADTGQTGADGLHAVTYEIGGSAAKGLITYSTPSGQEQQNGARVPWTKTFKAKGGELLGVSAQNGGGGSVTCSITVDGKVIKRGKSTGEYAIVSCDGMIGF